MFGDFAEVAQAAVGAGADESHVHFGAFDGLAGWQLHVVESFLNGDSGWSGGRAFGRRHILGDGDGLVGAGAPGDGGGHVLGADADDVVVAGVGVGGGGAPFGDGVIPGVTGGGIGPAFEIFEGLVIGVDVAAAGAAFDGHVADGHALLHGEAVEEAAAVFVGVADAAVGAEEADDVEDDVLGIDAGAQAAVHVDAADLHFAQGHGLGGEDVAHLRRADAEGDGAEGAVRGSVAVSAGDGGAGLGDALLGADDVDDALPAAAEAEVGDAELPGVFVQLLDHGFGEGVGEGGLLVVGGHDVVHGGEGAVGVGDFESEIAEHAEGLGAGDFVDEVGVNEELRLAVGEGADGVRFPDFFEECLAHGVCDVRD